MQPKNIKEFKELILRYESITLEEIEKSHKENSNYKKSLTGFGNKKTCKLCFGNVLSDCNKCLYAFQGGFEELPKSYHDSFAQYCWKKDNEHTYKAIESATTPQELKAAYKARAKHMRNILKDYYNENNT
jgi:hypothetical protein